MPQLHYDLSHRKDGEENEYEIRVGQQRWHFRTNQATNQALLGNVSLNKFMEMFVDLNKSCKGEGNQVVIGIVKEDSLKDQKVKQGMKMVDIPQDCRLTEVEDKCELVVSVGWDVCLVFVPVGESNGNVNEEIEALKRIVAQQQQEIEVLKGLGGGNQRIDTLQHIDELKRKNQLQTGLIEQLRQELDQLKQTTNQKMTRMNRSMNDRFFRPTVKSPVFTDCVSTKSNGNKTVTNSNNQWKTALTDLVFNKGDMVVVGLQTTLRNDWRHMYIGGCTSQYQTLQNANLAAGRYLGQDSGTHSYGFHFHNGLNRFKGTNFPTPQFFWTDCPCQIYVAVDMRDEGLMHVYSRKVQGGELRFNATLSLLNQRFPHGLRFAVSAYAQSDTVTIMPSIPAQDLKSVIRRVEA